MPGLVLEGGAFRGAYTDGVLDALLEHDIIFPYVIGVSAGVANAYSYVSLQKERNIEILERYRSDKRYVGVQNYRTQKSLFGLDFIYDEIPNKLVPYDYQALERYSGTILAGVTNALTGKAEYFGKEKAEPTFAILRASCALPVLFPPIFIDGVPYYDGGLADPIPIQKSMDDGNQKNLIVLTREVEYQKSAPSKGEQATSAMIRKKYPPIAHLMKKRHLDYNKTVAFCNQLSRDGDAVVLRPTADVNVGRLEKDVSKLRQLYDAGYRDTEQQLDAIRLLFESDAE